MKKLNWKNIAIVIACLVFGLLVWDGGCEDPAITAKYEEAVAGCHARYGEEDSDECVKRVNQRFGR